jgi:ankyrin repeat protein
LHSHQKPLLYLAAEKESIPLCEALLAKQADPNKLSSTGLAPMHLAANNPELFKLFLASKGLYSLPDGHQKDPIFYAVDKNNKEIVHLLLEKDGTVATRCNDKRTPLHDCAERGFIEVAVDLLDHGADVNARNWVTFSFIMFYLCQQCNATSSRCLLWTFRTPGASDGPRRKY